MIGSFWNLCRACPSMPIDKQLHSEYRSTYTWHEYAGPQQEHTVIRRAPQAPPSTIQASAKLQSAKSTEDENSEGPTFEPPLPRRKKYPELAYKSHEFIGSTDGGGIDAIDSNVVADKVKEVTGLQASQLSKAISRISTEYRLQFAWPKRPQLTNGEAVTATSAAAGSNVTVPRKSLSMGALKQGIVPTGPVPVHKKRIGDLDHKRDGVQASELEPLVGGLGMDAMDNALPEGDEREEDLTDLKTSFREKRSAGKSVRILERNDKRGKDHEKPFPTAEVIQLRRLADEYKHRDWGSGLTAEDEASLWKRVNNNHALNALSLARKLHNDATHQVPRPRSVTKEEKEKENTRKVAPGLMNVPAAGRPSSVQARPIHGLLQEELKSDVVSRARKDFLIRHHLDRTTGVGDGALLPSPTREKLEPVIPRRREDSKEHREEIQPRTKSSPKNSPRTGRSHSVGPTVTERRSPKRHPARAPSLTKDAKEKEKEIKDKEKDHRDRSREPERHPRPIVGSSRVQWRIREAPLNITVDGLPTPIPPLPPPPPATGQPLLHRRQPRVHRKSFLATNAPPHRPLHHAKPVTTTTTTTMTNSTASITSTIAKSSIKHSVHTSANHPSTASAAAAARPDRVKDFNHSGSFQGHSEARRAAAAAADPSKSFSDCRSASNRPAQAMTAEPRVNGDTTGGDSSVASTPPSQVLTAPAAAPATASPWIDDEPVVKSPPEPTRVKSPEQMIMRSPEPVNWTVPLDTGKTFTVTQNVREEPLTRPHSEAKSWTGSSLPSAPQSAPPELAQHKSQQHSGYKSPDSESVSLGSFGGINGHKDLDSERDSPLHTANVQGSATPTHGEESIEADDDSKAQVEELKADSLTKPIAGTNLRCLEDPSFDYERKESGFPTTVTNVAPPTTSHQPGYRVLEAETANQPGNGGGAAGSTGSYHVLEAPPIVSPGSAQRASDVLEKARSRFDKFWGKGPEN
ncbi:uncharacterized protein [Prorops nasuta]|uniref:uncharacterized protein isoform X3 n=1 Tax=Prorops nasuta TaxID=863751 RepID=UPI0034CED74B